MSLDEQPDPTLEQLFRLARPAEDPERSARTRRRCHDLMARRAAVQARQSASGPTRLSDAVLVLSIGVYLVAAVAEAVRVVGSL